jgi:hypothetical protein
MLSGRTKRRRRDDHDMPTCCFKLLDTQPKQSQWYQSHVQLYVP